jgi:hypothetical protein
MGFEVKYKPRIVDVPSMQFFCPRCEHICWETKIWFRNEAEAGFYTRLYGRLPVATVWCRSGCSEAYHNWAWKAIDDRDVGGRLRQKLYREQNGYTRLRSGSA